MPEESHLDEMRDAIRRDFERLAERRGEQGLLRVSRARGSGSRRAGARGRARAALVVRTAPLALTRRRPAVIRSWTRPSATRSCARESSFPRRRANAASSQRSPRTWRRSPSRESLSPFDSARSAPLRRPTWSRRAARSRTCFACARSSRAHTSSKLAARGMGSARSRARDGSASLPPRVDDSGACAPLRRPQRPHRAPQPLVSRRVASPDGSAHGRLRARERTRLSARPARRTLGARALPG